MKLHSPFSWDWFRAILGAPIPAWLGLLLLGISTTLGWRSHLFQQKYEAKKQEIAEANVTQGLAARAHDTKIFNNADAILNEVRLRALLDLLRTDDSYFSSRAQLLYDFVSFSSRTSNRFMDPELISSNSELVQRSEALASFLATSFFVYPENQNYPNDTRLCLYPDLNIDRAGSGTPDSMKRYNQFQTELDNLISALETSYTSHRLNVKRRLYL